MLPERQIIVETVLEGLPDAVAIYLFGSRVRPTDLHAASDWDVAVLEAGGGMSARAWWDLRYALAAALDAEKVDVVPLKQSNFLIRDTVLREGVILYSGDDFARVTWEIATSNLIEEWIPVYERTSAAFHDRFQIEHA